MESDRLAPLRKRKAEVARAAAIAQARSKWAELGIAGSAVGQDAPHDLAEHMAGYVADAFRRRVLPPATFWAPGEVWHHQTMVSGGGLPADAHVRADDLWQCIAGLADRVPRRLVVVGRAGPHHWGVWVESLEVLADAAALANGLPSDLWLLSERGDDGLVVECCAYYDYKDWPADGFVDVTRVYEVRAWGALALT